MGFNLYAEVEYAKFLDWVENNKNKIIEYLKLEHEQMLVHLYNHKELIE